MAAVTLYLFSFVGHYVLVIFTVIRMEELQMFLNVSEKDSRYIPSSFSSYPENVV